MSGEDIKKILYDAVDSVGRDEMQIAINSDASTSRQYITKFVSAYRSATSDVNGDATVFLEAMMHLMLTISGIPSERKVSMGNEELDIVIPSLKAMIKDPHKSLAIFIVDSDPSAQIQLLQANCAGVNSWVISCRPVTSTWRNYSMENGLSVSEIIVDLKSFLEANGIRTLRLFS